MCHGDICRASTRAVTERVQGRLSWNVVSDIGAIESGL
jgi:hypothetical protein